MIEFDVLPLDHRDRAGSPLILAHDYTHDVSSGPDAPGGPGAPGRRALRRGSSSTSTSSSPGYEERVVEGAAGLRAGRAQPDLEPVLREPPARPRPGAAPAARLVGAEGHPATTPPRSVYKLPALAALPYLSPSRSRAGRRAASATGRSTPSCAHWRLASRRFVRAVHGAGGELYVWTVDEAPRIRGAGRRWGSRASSRTTRGCSRPEPPGIPHPAPAAVASQHERAGSGHDLAGHRIEDVIGRGGMGIVYRAVQPSSIGWSHSR